MKHLLKSCYCGYSYLRHGLAVVLCFLGGSAYNKQRCQGAKGEKVAGLREEE